MELFLAFISQHLILAGAFVSLVALYFFTELRRSGQAVTPQHLVSLVNRDAARVVDLRDGAEYRAGHIAGAINIPLKDLDKHMGELAGCEDTPVVLVCKQGQLASGAGKTLREKGFTQVFRLAGGIGEWEAARLPLVKK
ncbi:MAG TPA: rhodanese-like domain-containing protein [Pseudomonadales bacterium]